MSRTRALTLAGGCNFRDFGGYPTTDGRAVQWGRLYRSGVLSGLTPQDLQAVAGLGLRVVCDLRRTDERLHNPNPEFGTNVTTLSWDTGVETSPLRDRQFAQSQSMAAARAAMREMYRRLPFVLGPRLRGVFAAMQRCRQGDAVVVHCSAGKDRTGIAVALIQLALGVPRESVIADYVLTNTTVDLRRQLLRSGATGAGMTVTAAPILALSAAARDAILDADAAYLAASLDAIEARHRSVQVYLESELGVDEAAVTRLQDTFLVARSDA
jgi:protein-tyrosine phosphatase